MEHAPRVSSPHRSFWTRFAIVFLAIAAACLGLVTMHSATSHAHGSHTVSHEHTSVLTGETAAGIPTDAPENNSGLLANCDSCALGTAAKASSALVLLLLAWVMFQLVSNPSAFARLLERSQVIASTAASGARRFTPPPLALGISRT
jgi:hypothetical protein